MKARPALADDIPAIVEVVNRAYRVEEFFLTGDRTTDVDIRSRIAPPVKNFLVVDDDKRTPGTQHLAGAVYVELRGERGYFGMLAVDPERQGLGLGRLLVNAAEEYCRAAACRHLDIVTVNLRTELPPFYERLGYRTSGTAPFPDSTRLLQEAHLVIMTKQIAPE